MQYGPRAYVTWVAIEESAEGGDALFLRARQSSRFLDGFERVAEGGGVALYRRAPSRPSEFFSTPSRLPNAANDRLVR